MSPVEAGEHKRTNQMTPTHLPFPSSVQINAQLRGSKEGVLENQHGTFVGQVHYQLETPPPTSSWMEWSVAFSPLQG